MLITKITDQISAETQTLLRNLGLIPEDITVSLDERCLTIQLHHLFTSAQETMVRLDQHDMRATRDLIVDYVIPDLGDFINKVSGIKFESMYYDWNDSDSSGLIIGLPQGSRYREHEDYYPGKDEIHRQVAKITYDVQKVPDSIYSFWTGDNMLVIVREGLFIKLEKELIKLGFTDGLWTAKRTLERQSFLSEAQATAILKRKHRALYVDWQFELDKSALVYAFDG
ncbi:hypothetical protein SD71_10350 [Cohnella kolymensis]|uniref:Na+-translocating membrane potential-generating system MpsC domain-containing protein n=1 Tax=Cohnella kolymensis TaxID=1590652 RepID=A0ABR5A5S9_9BACL|nr:Na-translocating system protein MpsC family protein [Cohnella kolymensis]KIL35802.1 hypothetical protein SD71_10350 [Cohnella kolymensis]